MTRVRPATSADLDAVVDLEQTCLGGDAWSRGLVEQGIAAAMPTVAYLVAEVDGAVVGHAVASAAGDDAELQRIAVAPAYRRTGVASALLAEVERRAAADGAARLLLEVREDNTTAAAFYESRGFEAVGRRRGTTGTVPPQWSWGRSSDPRRHRVSDDSRLGQVVRRVRQLHRPRVCRIEHGEPFRSMMEQPARVVTARAGARPAGGSDVRRGQNVRREPDSTDAPLVLGIETSCDETGVGLVRGTTLLADAVAELGRRARPLRWGRTRGGASRRTSRRWCLRSSGPARPLGVRLYDVDAVAVTSGPGLAGALLVGVARREGSRHRLSASRSTASTTSPPTWPSTSSSTARSRAVPGPARVAVGTPRCWRSPT